MYKINMQGHKKMLLDGGGGGGGLTLQWLNLH